MVAVLLLAGRYRYGLLVAIFFLLMWLMPREQLLMSQSVDAHFYRQYFLMMSDSVNIDFLAGLLAAVLWQRMSDRAGIMWWLIMVGTVVYFLLAVTFLYAPFGDMGNPHTSVMTLPCFLLFICGLKFSKIKPRQYPRWLLFAGKISYSLYLLHMAVIFTLVSLAQNIFGMQYFDEFSHRFNLLLVSLGVTFVLSWYCYSMIEIKLSVFLRDKLLAVMNL